MAKSIEGSEQYTTPSKESKPFDNKSLRSNKLFLKLYADSETLQKKRRTKQAKYFEEENKEWTFKPEKLSSLDYEYFDEFKDPFSRLYNSWFINSSINIYSLKSSQFSKPPTIVTPRKVHERLYSEGNKRKQRYTSLVTRVDKETGLIFHPKINKSSREKVRQQRERSSQSMHSARSQHTWLALKRADFSFAPIISEKTKKLAVKKRSTKNMIPKPNKNKEHSLSPSECSDRLFNEYKTKRRNLEKLKFKLRNESDKELTFTPTVNTKSAAIIKSKKSKY